MVSIHGLSVHFASNFLFNNISFQITEKDRIGLVGKNGAGKSTLLKVIAGEQSSDEGKVAIPKDFTIGYLPQEMQHNEDATIMDEAASAFEEVNLLQARIDEITEEMMNRTDYESEAYGKLVTEMNDATERLTMIGGYNIQENIEKVLQGLGFEQGDFERKMSEFSGGWKMRVELAKILLMTPNLLLLDEPTNHLDIESIQWLEDFLKGHDGAIVLISHDRAFLDNITKRTIEISNGKIYDYKSPYSKYLVLRAEERERQEQAYKNQQKHIEHTEQLINKFRAKKNKAAFAQTLIRKLDKMERIEVDNEDKTKMRVKFPPAPRSGKIVVEGKKLGKSYGEKQVLNDLDITVTRGDKIALVGKNGVGKTTLIKLIVGESNHTGDLEIGHNVAMGYYAQNQAELLDGNKTVYQTIEDELTLDVEVNIRSLLGGFLFSGDDVDKKVKVLSGGEKGRLALCKLLLTPRNLLVLDEPTNHLDIRSKEVLKSALEQYDGTLVLVSHDRDFLHGLTDHIYEVQNGEVKLHYDDIYDFLKKKKSETIREFEQVQQEKANKEKKTSSNKLDYEQRKQRDRDIRKAKNAINKCEKGIEKVEEEMKQLDAKMAGGEVVTKEDSDAFYQRYFELNKQQEQLMEDWEKQQELLASLDAME